MCVWEKESIPNAKLFLPGDIKELTDLSTKTPPPPSAPPQADTRPNLEIIREVVRFPT